MLDTIAVNEFKKAHKYFKYAKELKKLAKIKYTDLYYTEFTESVMCENICSNLLESVNHVIKAYCHMFDVKCPDTCPMQLVVVVNCTRPILSSDVLSGLCRLYDAVNAEDKGKVELHTLYKAVKHLMRAVGVIGRDYIVSACYEEALRALPHDLDLGPIVANIASQLYMHCALTEQQLNDREVADKIDSLRKRSKRSCGNSPLHAQLGEELYDALAIACYDRFNSENERTGKGLAKYLSVYLDAVDCEEMEDRKELCTVVGLHLVE